MPKIVSIDDLNTDEGSGYSASFEYSYSQPSLVVKAAERDGESPLVTAVGVGLTRPPSFSVYIEGDDVDNLRVALLRALDTSGGAKAVTIADDDGGNERYIMIHVEKVDQEPGGGGRSFVITSISSEDVRWRAADPTTETWSVTSSGAAHVVANGGELESFPVWTVTPRGAKSSSNWPYARRALVRPRYSPLGMASPRTPLEITGGGWNTAALVTAGKMSDGTNIAVMVDGRYVPHWYGGNDGAARGFNYTDTTIWINLGLRQDVSYLYLPVSEEETALVVYHADYIDDAGWLSFQLPARGRLYFAETGEVVSYDGINRRGNGLHDLLNVKRGVDGTTAAALSASAVGEFIHEILVLYGPDGAVPTAERDAAYQYQATLKPLVANSASTNGLWSWTYFKSGARTADWNYLGERFNAQYTEATDVSGTTGDFVEPWTAMGWKADRNAVGYFYISLPLPMTGLVVTGRHMAGGDPVGFPGAPWLMLRYGDYQTNAVKLWGAEMDEPSEFSNTAFSLSIDVSSRPQATGLRWKVADTTYVQADIQTLQTTFDPDYTPLVTLGAEFTDYDMELLIENETTGEALTITLPNMALDEAVVIDCATQKVTYTGDNSNRYTAVRRDAPRRRFLRLAPGDNTVRVTEGGLTDVDISVTFRERFYT